MATETVRSGTGARAPGTGRGAPPTAPKAPFGAGAFGWVEQLAGMMVMTAQTMKAAAVPPYNYWGATIEECWLVTKRSFIPALFCVLVFSIGAPGITGGSIIATLATTDRLGAFSIMASVRELATWINGMVVAGVAGTAICSDLGARKIREELDALAVLGTDLIKVLVLPRFIALGVMIIAFNYWTTAISIFGQMLANMLVWQESAAGFIATFSSNFTIAEVVFNALKLAGYGFIIAVVCCYKGMNAKGGSAGVGRAVNQAVVIAFTIIYFFNALINSVMLAAFPETATLR